MLPVKLTEIISNTFPEAICDKKGKRANRTVIIHCKVELAQRNGTLPPPPGLISDSVNIVHSAIKVHCAGGGEGGEGIDRNAAENEVGEK